MRDLHCLCFRCFLNAMCINDFMRNQNTMLIAGVMVRRNYEWVVQRFNMFFLCYTYHGFKPL